MAHHVEPMDIDSDFDNKENSLHHNNVLPFTEKGYEELDVSELNMKLRYSVTPASSPMSKSYTATCPDNRSMESGDETLNVSVSENVSLTRSLNSTMTKNDGIVKSLKALPLQSIMRDQYVDSNRNTSVLRPLDSSTTLDNDSITVSVSAPNDIDENLSLPSSSSSVVHTPEATTPTKDISKDGGSPILRGLKSVLSMFRSSQSPIPSADMDNVVKSEILSPVEESASTPDSKPELVLASTPISSHRKKEMSPTKRNSPPKDSSMIFNEDLLKELQWKDETTIIFSRERIPIHKLLLQPQDNKKLTNLQNQDVQDLNTTVKYMDISYNDTIQNKTMTDFQENKRSDTPAESDNEFVDCETTITQNMSTIEDSDKTPLANQTQELNLVDLVQKNDSGSRLKPIILDTTQDILDATLSVRPEDLLPEVFNQTQNISALVNKVEIMNTFNDKNGSNEIREQSTLLQNNQPFDQTINITNPMNALAEDLNVTKPSEEMTITQPINQTFDAINPSTNIGNLDSTVSKQNVLDNTLALEEQLDNSGNLNISVSDATVGLNNKSFEAEVSPTIELNNKTFENKVTPIEENVTNETNFDITSKICNEINVTTSDKEPVATALNPSPLEEVICKPFTEVSTTELPVDIPLPDEDDLEKELNIPDDIAALITPPVSLPIDLVEDIKTITGDNEAINTLEETEVNVTKILNTNNIRCATVNALITEGGESRINETDSTQTVGKGFEHDKHVIVEQDLPNKLKETDSPLPEVVSSNVTSDEIVVNNKMNNKNNELNATATIDVNKTLENIEPHHYTSTRNITVKQEAVSMNVNESVCEIKPLPDVINQIIALSNTESLELNPNVPALVEKEQAKIVASHLDIPIGTNNAMNEIENKINSNLTNVKGEIDIKTAFEAELPTKLQADIMDPKKLPNVCTPCNTDNVKTLEKAVDAMESNTINLILNNNIASIVNTTPLDVGVIHHDVEKSKVNEVEEEIVLSGNNSPFVSVIADNMSEDKPDTNIQYLKEPLVTKTRIVVTPPSSPPIASKGYNFNFDDMDFDPFATKTKIRVSPPTDSPNKPTEPVEEVKIVAKPVPKKDFNRRRSQPERKKPAPPKRKLNSTFDGKVNDKAIEKSIEKTEVKLDRDIEITSSGAIALEKSNITIEENKLDETIDQPSKSITLPKEILNPPSEIVHEDKAELPVESLTKESLSNIECSHELKTTSSSEQSTYYSAGTSGSDISIPSKNVFNLPEIDDMNFNPFATKSKMRQSPLSTQDNPFVTKSKIENSLDSSMITPEKKESKSFEDKNEAESMEKDLSSNSNNVTVSLKPTDEDNTSGSTTHIPTEDDDTTEGPFFETEDFNHDDKMSDFDGDHDMMHFNELTTQNNNLDSGEMFIDAEAFEFLLNQNKANTIVDSGKESLFLKFDPLFAKRMSAVTSDGVVASLAKLQKRQSTPTKVVQTPPKNMPSPIAGPSNLNVTQDMDMNEDFNDDLNITVSKPMMVVPPAVNPVTPRNKSLTPNRSNRRSITFTSPAMAVIDRLLSLSANNSLVHDTTVTHVSREQNEADIALSQLRELLAEKEISVYTLRSESNDLRDRLCTLENHVKSLEAEGESRLKKINDLTDTLAEKTKINKSMAAVVEEYERTIASLIAETAQDKKRHAEEKIQLINERDEQTAHLASMEVSFSDLHSKYEKSKQIILNCKANEDSYKKSIKEFEENLVKMQNNYELLKQHATSKLNHANQELEKINRSHEAEVLKLNAMIKRKDLHITSLEESLAQKTKANEELTAICDELINKVG